MNGATATSPPSSEGPLLCMIHYAYVSDAGFTYAFNKGHRQFFTWFEEAYPSVPFRTKIIPFGFIAPNRTQLGRDLITVDGCRVIVSQNVPIDQVRLANDFPNVTIFFYGSPANNTQQLVTQPPNLRLFYLRLDRPYFTIGVAAAQYASTCIGFVTAFENASDVEAGTNGFILGVRSVNATIAVHVVTMQSWYRPDDEVHATDLLLSMGCEVVGRYIDSQAVDQTVSSWPNRTSHAGVDGTRLVYLPPGAIQPTQRRPLSVGVHSDASLVVGDTVLSSALVDWAPTLREMLLPILLNNATPLRPYYMMSDAYQVPRESAFASPMLRMVAIRRDTADRFAANESVYCGTITRRDGTVFPQPANQCMNNTAVLRGYVAGATVHPSPFPDAASCPAGRFPLFTTAPLITMRCEQCPAGTFSAGGKQLQCLPCKPGTGSGEGSAECTSPPSFTAVYVAAGVFSFIIAVVAAVLGTLLYRSLQARRDLSFAPKDADVPFAIVFVDVESSTTLWARVPQAMSGAVDVHHRVLREVIRAHRGYEVKTIGDAFMVAFKHVEDAVLFATDAQLRLHDADWGPAACAAIDGIYRDLVLERMDSGYYAPLPKGAVNGLRVRIGVNYGTGTIAFDPTTQAYDYYGTVVNMAARIESVGHGGQVLVSRPVLSGIIGCPQGDTGSFRRTLAAQSGVATETFPLECGGAVIAVAPLGPQQLRGLDLPLELFQLRRHNAPPAVRSRVFPPLRLYATATGVVDEDRAMAGTDPARISSSISARSRTGSISSDAGDWSRVAAQEYATVHPFVCLDPTNTTPMDCGPSDEEDGDNPGGSYQTHGRPVNAPVGSYSPPLASLSLTDDDMPPGFIKSPSSGVRHHQRPQRVPSLYLSATIPANTNEYRTLPSIAATLDHLMEAFHLLRTQLSPLSDAKRLELVAVLAGAWRLPKPRTTQTSARAADRLMMSIVCRSAPVAYAAMKDRPRHGVGDASGLPLHL